MRGMFVWGFFLGIIAMTFVESSPLSNGSRYREAIKNCEKSLPRDKHCVVIGVPE